MTVKKKIDVEYRQRGAKKAQKEMNKLGTSIQSTMMKYVGAGIAITTVTRLLSKSIEAYGVQELAEKKLQTALGKTSKELLDYASNLQLVSSYGDESIINVMGLIGAFVKDEKSIKEATKATLDFAAATGMDLNSAGQLVAKTLGSTTDALTRYGMKTVGAVGSTERLKSMTEGIAKLWGGQAKDQADTFTGSITQMSMAFGDLTEKFGKMAAKASESFPIFETLADTFRFMGEYFEEGGFIPGPWTDPEDLGALIKLIKESKNLTKSVEEQKKISLEHGLAMEVAFDIEKQLGEARKKRIAEQDKLNEEYHQNLKNRLEENEEAYQKFAKAIDDKIEKDKEQLEFQERYNEENFLTLAQQREAIINMEEITPILKEQQKEFKKVEKVGVKAFEKIGDEVGVLGATINWEVGKGFIDTFHNAMNESLVHGENFFQSFIDGFKNMLAQLAAEILARGLILSIFSMFTGGAGFLRDIGYISGKASGGLVQGGESYLVGERGAEIFTPSTSGNITPNEEIGQTININIMGNVVSNRDWIRRELIPEIYRAQGRGY